MQAHSDDTRGRPRQLAAGRSMLSEEGLGDVAAVVFTPDAPALLPFVTGAADPAATWRQRATMALGAAVDATAATSIAVIRSTMGPRPRSWRTELGLPGTGHGVGHGTATVAGDVPGSAAVPDDVDVPLGVGLALVSDLGWTGRVVAVEVDHRGSVTAIEQLSAGTGPGGSTALLVLGSGSACGRGPGTQPPRATEEAAAAVDAALAAAIRMGDRQRLAQELSAIDPADAQRWQVSGWAAWRAAMDMLDPVASWVASVDIVRPWGVDYPIGSWVRVGAQEAEPRSARPPRTAGQRPHLSAPPARPDADLLVVAIVGPTATGKSDLAVDLARELNAEIVNADAMQLYRGMDIGTAKLTLSERKGVPHHQLDVLDVTEDANVASYQERARADIAEIRRRGRRPMLVGGSGLYVRAALDRIDFPGTDPQVRAALEARAESEGPAALHAELAQRDPVAAAQILPTNARRIVRALEVIELTGGPFIAAMPAHVYAIPAIQLGIDVPKQVLTERIEARVDRMLAGGLIDEVTGLIDRGLRRGRTARHAVGYAEALAYIDGEIDLDEARARMIRATRRLARRQTSWFGQDHRVQWLAWEDPDPLTHALAIIARASAEAGADADAH